MKKLLLVLTVITCNLALATCNSFAQIDLQCDGRDQHSLYLVAATGFYRIDSVDTQPTTPKLVATNPGGVGISINKNINTKSGLTTMYYVTSTGEYFYWNDTVWVDTHFTTGSSSAVNPGGSDNYIYNLNGTNGVLRYDGTSDTGLNVGHALYTSIADIACDKNGNFYLFNSGMSYITAYTPNGILIDSFSVTGIPFAGGPGFAILGSRMYAVGGNGQNLYEGIQSGNTFNFTKIEDLSSYQFQDVASCSKAGETLAFFKVPDAPHFIIYPNPATDKAVIKMDNTSSIEAFDCMGRKVLQKETNGLSQYELQLAGWIRGVYFVTATSEKGLISGTTLVVQ